MWIVCRIASEQASIPLETILIDFDIYCWCWQRTPRVRAICKEPTGMLSKFASTKQAFQAPPDARYYEIECMTIRFVTKLGSRKPLPVKKLMQRTIWLKSNVAILDKAYPVGLHLMYA
jgi:hypothetical protein